MRIAGSDIESPKLRLWEGVIPTLYQCFVCPHLSTGMIMLLFLMNGWIQENPTSIRLRKPSNVRIVGKLYFDTTVSQFSGSHINFYAYSTGNYDQYATYSTASSTTYSNTIQQTGTYGGGNGYSYIQIGEGMYPSKYNGSGQYNWGSDVTDVDGNTVASDSPRRGVWTNFVIDAYYQNTNKMPSFKIKTAAATNGFST